MSLRERRSPVTLSEHQEIIDWKRCGWTRGAVKLFPLHSIVLSGRGSAWLERLVRDQEVGGSNPLAPTIYPEVNQLLLIPNFRHSRGIGNIWEQNHLFEPFHGVPLASGKHMRVPKCSL